MDHDEDVAVAGLFMFTIALAVINMMLGGSQLATEDGGLTPLTWLEMVRVLGHCSWKDLELNFLSSTKAASE